MSDNARNGSELSCLRFKSRSDYVWKLGALRWGGLMFVIISILRPLIPHAASSPKPFSLWGFLLDSLIGLCIWIPAGALFGLSLWAWTRRKEDY